MSLEALECNRCGAPLKSLHCDYCQTNFTRTKDGKTEQPKSTVDHQLRTLMGDRNSVIALLMSPGKQPQVVEGYLQKDQSLLKVVYEAGPRAISYLQERERVIKGG